MNDVLEQMEHAVDAMIVGVQKPDFAEQQEMFLIALREFKQNLVAVRSDSKRKLFEQVFERLSWAKAGDDHPRWHEGVQCAIELIKKLEAENA
jgi:hypothetical protein